MASTNLTPETPHMLTIRETADFLRIAVPTVWRLLHDGKLPRTRIGGRTFVKREALDAFIADNTAADVA